MLSNRLFSNLRRLNNTLTFSSDGVLVTKVDMLTGASLPIPDTLLEIEGRDALAMALDTWKVLSEELMDKGGEMRVVLIRQIENVESSLIRYAIYKISITIISNFSTKKIDWVFHNVLQKNQGQKVF